MAGEANADAKRRAVANFPELTSGFFFLRGR
jgi:hypothetical protein